MVSDNLKHFLFSVFSLIICACVVSACSTNPPNETVQTQPIDEPETENRIEELLFLAEEAFSRDRLTTPVNDNAYLWYLQVLAVDNENVAANHGISDIVERYLSWALDRSDAGDFESAFDYIAKAKSIDDTHPNISAVEAHVASKTALRVAHFPISKHQLVNKSDALKGQLLEIAEEINRLDASVIIKSPER